MKIIARFLLPRNRFLEFSDQREQRSLRLGGDVFLSANSASYVHHGEPITGKQVVHRDSQSATQPDEQFERRSRLPDLQPRYVLRRDIEFPCELLLCERERFPKFANTHGQIDVGACHRKHARRKE